MARNLKLIDVWDCAIGQAPELLARVGNHQNPFGFPALKISGVDRLRIAEAQINSTTDLFRDPRSINKAFLKQARKNFKPGFRPWGAR
jgi:hypothetical protein